MKGKETKKEKRYFCDWWEKLINKDSLFITYIIIIIFTALGVSYFAITHYLDRQEEYKDLLDDYSDKLYDELEADVVNHINTRKTIDEVALHEIADTHSSSYDGEVTILNCSKKNSSGFEARITIAMSKNAKILWINREFKMKEEYIKDKERNIVWREYPHILPIPVAVMTFVIYTSPFIAARISKKRKKRDEEQKEKNKTGFEQ